MSNIVNKGSLLPPEIVRDMINLVRGKSSLARLSAARPVSFNGNEYFTFNFDNEVSIVGESAAKVNGGVTVAPVTVRPYKFEYGARFSDEFMYASEEYQMDTLRQFAEGFAGKSARGVDIAAFHGLNPRTGAASAVVGDNHFDSKVTQTATVTADANADVESAIALVQGNEHDVTGMAMAPAFRTALAQLKKSGTSNEPMFPELGWGAAPGVINGLPVDANSTVSFGANTKDRAIVGNFRDFFRWGFAKDISIEVIEYGNPDNDAEAGDLKGHNQIYIRGECYIGWGILVPAAFARIITT